MEHSTGDVTDVTIDRGGIEPLMGWPTPAMAPALDDWGEPSGWYVGVTPDGYVIETGD